MIENVCPQNKWRNKGITKFTKFKLIYFGLYMHERT